MSEPALPRRGRVAASAAFAVQGLCFAGVLTKVPDLKDRFGFSELHLSLILLIVPVLAGVGSVVAGALAPRTGSGAVLRVAGLIVCAGVAGIGAAHTEALLYAAVAVFGMAVGAVDATMNMQGVAVQRRYGRSLLLSFHGWWSVAGIAASLSNAGTARLHWPLAASLGLIAVVGAVIVIVAAPDFISSGTPVGVPVDAKTAPPWKPVVLIGLAVMVAYICESSTSNWSALFLTDALAAGNDVAPLGLAAYLTTQLLGRIGADQLVGRFGPVPVIVAGGLIAVAGLATVAVAPGPAVAIAGFAATGVGLCVVVPLSFSAAGALDPHGTGIAIARVNLFNYLGFVVGAALIGVIAESVNLRWAFAVPAVLAFGIVALAPTFRVAPAPGPSFGEPEQVPRT